MLYLERSGDAMDTLRVRGSLGSYLPLGLAAARTEHLVCSLHTSPALATLRDCCSIDRYDHTHR